METNASGGTVDIGASASWYGLIYRGGAVTVTDTGGGHALTLELEALTVLPRFTA